ncbi:WYL domain-containing protein [Vibrio aphrogenes]|uniref:WYL domain-containing protein n=1 Tax=Vibrio aphrogenes TaxID=1891186 RepID=UPI000B35F5FF|nr:WYL domain-containing protein [Vibrio aphrogenes]
MQLSEALFLVLAEKFLFRSLPPESQKSLELRLNKAHKTISKANALEQWQRKLHVIGGQIPYHNDELVAEWRQTIYQAVLSELQINLKYKKLDADKATEYQLNPLAIIVREHSHYLVATKLETPDKSQLFNCMHRIGYFTINYIPIKS